MQIKRTKIKLEKQDTTMRKASLAGQASSAKAGSPLEENVQDILAGFAGTHGGKATSPNDSTTTHVVDQCSVKPQSD